MRADSAHWLAAFRISVRTAGYVAPACKDLYEVVHADCFDWMDKRAPNSIHAVVTDPPYGMVEYEEKNHTKLRKGRGGVWRIPPSFDGAKRRPADADAAARGCS